MKPDGLNDRVASSTPIEFLAGIEGQPWADWKAGRATTPNQLAPLAGGFGIVSKNLRTGSGVFKGYSASAFADASRRCLAKPPALQRRDSRDGAFERALGMP